MGESFIAAARRDQIIQACIQTLDEVGYVNISLTKIAKKAKISTGLISYHFKDKEDLINHTLMHLVERQTNYIIEKVHLKETPSDRLAAFIEASLAYQGTHPIHNIALIEIIFNARTEAGIPFYKLADDEEDALLLLLLDILKAGKEANVFSAPFDHKMIAVIIQGAIAETMFKIGENFELESYTEQLIKAVNKMLQ